MENSHQYLGIHRIGRRIPGIKPKSGADTVNPRDFPVIRKSGSGGRPGEGFPPAVSVSQGLCRAAAAPGSGR